MGKKWKRSLIAKRAAAPQAAPAPAAPAPAEVEPAAEVAPAPVEEAPEEEEEMPAPPSISLRKSRTKTKVASDD